MSQFGGSDGQGVELRSTDSRARLFPTSVLPGTRRGGNADSAGGRGYRLGKLFPLFRSGLGCFADLQSHVARSKANPDLLEEAIGGSAPGKDPDIIVRNLLPTAVDLNDHRLRLELNRIRVEQHLQLSGAREVFDALGVPLFDAAETLAAVGHCDLVARLAGETHGGLNCAVTASYHEDLLIDVVIGLDEAVHHLRQLLAFDAEFAWLPRFAQRQDHSPGPIVIVHGVKREDAVFAPLDVFHLLAGDNV